MPEPALRHLTLPKKPSRLDYKGSGRGTTPRQVDRALHGASLRKQIEAVETQITALEESRIEQGLPAQVDLILELESAPDFPLSADHLHALTAGTNGTISLLHARPFSVDAGPEHTIAVLHVKYGSLHFLVDKVRRYQDEMTKKGNTPNPWLANIERIGVAALSALWTDLEHLPQDNERHWWELWVRREPSTLKEFDLVILRLEIQQRAERLTLPDHVIVVAQATRAQLETSLDLLNTLAEVRRARPCSIGLSDLRGSEQEEWIDEALNRVELPAANAPAVCLLDSGVNRGHRLIAPILAEGDNHTVFGDRDASDCWPGGHGTQMAGLAAYGDLRSLMLSNQKWPQTHRLEGVRLIDPARLHEPENYGQVTKQGISLPEVSAPHRRRIYSLAVTSDGINDARPTSWSSAVDAAAFGAEEEGEPKRVILVSAGNVDALSMGAAYQYPRDNRNLIIQDPAQAWNAVTVGALTHRDHIQEADAESRLLSPVAAREHLSPFSRTSCEADAHWPMKPEIVMEGGNIGLHPQNGPERRDSLDLLSTAAEFRVRPICGMRATSAATALAARLAAQLQAAYPNYWAETIRGLLVHSAQWNGAMLGDLKPFAAFSREQRAQFVQMIRCYGFGEPDAGRARFSSQQAVTLLREDVLMPFKGTAGAAGLNDCHIHGLPLPTALLQANPAATCTLKVTLSHFTAPNPSASNRIPGSRYRYAGCLLRFQTRHKDDSIEEFEARIAKAAEEDEESNEGAPDHRNDPAWALGAKLRGKAGSLVQDVWQGSAADLSQMDRIAVFPVKGWWASRSFNDRTSPWHHCHRRTVRYSLIVSVEIAADVELYNEINNLIVRIPVDVPIGT
jgi:hypothetical protein